MSGVILTFLVAIALIVLVFVARRLFFAPPPAPPRLDFSDRILYVSDGKEPGTVYLFQRDFNEPSFASISVTGRPLGLAFDNSDSHPKLYVASNSTNQVLIYSDPGLSSSSTPDVVNVPAPTDVVFDPVNLRVFVAGWWTGRNDPDPGVSYGNALVGVYRSPLSAGDQRIETIIYDPEGVTGVAVDSAGRFYLVAHPLPLNHAVYEYDARNVPGIGASFEHNSDNFVAFDSPSPREPLGMAVDGMGRLLVANAATVDIFLPPMTPTAGFPGGPVASRPPDISIPMPPPARAISVRIDDNGNLFVAAKTSVLIYAPPLTNASQPALTVNVPGSDLNISGVALGR